MGTSGASDAGRRIPAWGWGLGALTLLAALLRFAGLGRQSFWYDEAWTAYLVRLRPGELLRMVPRTESTPPLYYMVAWAWARAIGRDEAGLRSLSALAGTLTVPVAFAAGTTLATRRVGLVVAALAATSPVLVWYGQEARSYAMLVLLSALSLLCCARARRGPARAWLAAWALVSVAALATHYFAVFVVAPEAALLLWQAVVSRRGGGARAWTADARGVLAAVAGVALAGGLLLLIATRQERHGNGAWIQSIPLRHRVGELPRELLAGFPPGPAWIVPAGAAVVAGAVALLLLRADARERRAALLAGGIGIAALALPLGLAGVGLDFFLTRNLLVAWLPLALVLAAGLGARRAGRLGTLLAVCLCAISLAAVGAVARDSALQRPPWRTLSARLGPIRPDRASVLVHAGFALPLAIHRPDAWFMRGSSALLREIDVVTANARNTPFVWWGAIGGIARTHPADRPPARGFALAGRLRAGELTITRFVAAQARAVRERALMTHRGTVVLVDGVRSPIPR